MAEKILPANKEKYKKAKGKKTRKKDAFLKRRNFRKPPSEREGDHLWWWKEPANV